MIGGNSETAAMGRRPVPVGLGVAFAVLVLDQASKWWILADLMNPPGTIEVFAFFNLVLVFNRGISFGLFPAGDETGKWLLVGVALVICIALVLWLRRAETKRVIAALGFIVGGALGNVVDRVLHGAVVDFIDIHAAGYHWPAFNLADSAICLGAGLLIVDSLTSVAQDKAQERSAND